MNVMPYNYRNAMGPDGLTDDEQMMGSDDPQARTQGPAPYQPNQPTQQPQAPQQPIPIGTDAGKDQPLPPRTFAQMQAEGQARPPAPVPAPMPMPVAPQQFQEPAPADPTQWEAPYTPPGGPVEAPPAPTASAPGGNYDAFRGMSDAQRAAAFAAMKNDPSTYTDPDKWAQFNYLSMLAGDNAAMTTPEIRAALLDPSYNPGQVVQPGSNLAGLLNTATENPGEGWAAPDGGPDRTLQDGVVRGTDGQPLPAEWQQQFSEDNGANPVTRGFPGNNAPPPGYDPGTGLVNGGIITPGQPNGPAAKPAGGPATAPGALTPTPQPYTPLPAGMVPNAPTPFTPTSPAAPTGAAGAAPGVPGSPGASDILSLLTQGATGQGAGSAVQSATERNTLNLLNNPSPYGTKEVQDEYNWLGGNIDDEYALKQTALDEEMARRGLGVSTNKAGRLNDLNIGKRSAKATLGQDLANKFATTSGQYQRDAINTGNTVGTTAQGNQQNWLGQLMGYGQQGFNNDMAVNTANQTANQSYQDFILRMLGMGYGAAA